ncbi:MAG: ACP S-malonyltransferase [Bdellovibrionales bacterium]|nr:ACP S-malonyltransferase [Bdellovibrionales bacterium]
MNKSYVFLFPGQGSQSVGMCKELYDSYGVIQSTFEEASDTLDFSMEELVFQGPLDRLTQTQNTQPAILTVEVAIARLLEEQGISPLITAGHSLGEYACLVIAKAMSFSDALTVVRKRGQLMQNAVALGEGTMAAVLGEEDECIEDVCKEISRSGHIVEPANYNCPGQLVISGHTKAVQEACEILKERGAKRCIPLQVSAPFHSSLLRPCGEDLAEELEKIDICNLSTPYVSNIDAHVVHQPESIQMRLSQQVWKPVLWKQSLERLIASYPEANYLEVGPGNVGGGHLKKVSKHHIAYRTDHPDLISKLT